MNTTITFEQLLNTTIAGSRYAKHTLDSDSQLSKWLQNNYTSRCNQQDIIQILHELALDLDNEDQLGCALRRLRKRVMLKLILRDLNGLTDLNEIMQAMTALAEIALQQAQHCVMQQLVSQYGHPIGEHSQQPQQLLILGMGKLGGGELNVSSDIDLIFIYPEAGHTDGQRRTENHEFFTRLGRRLIRLINEATADGYVFRVDMRLRPYGDSGPLVMSFDALEQYLITQGREWERYAWIKARVVSPKNAPDATELSQMTRPFMFRKYLDFGAIDSMRQLHVQIRQEVNRRDRMNNIKLGPGGIREIEFIAQVFQLIRGGQNPRLQIKPTQQVLGLLTELQLLDADIVAQLDQAYIFLRNLEHRLQYLDDRQIQDLPDKAEDQQIIATTMGCNDYAALLQQLDHYRQQVSRQFDDIFGPPDVTEDPTECWQSAINDGCLARHLTALGFAHADNSATLLAQFRDSNRYAHLPEASKQRLNRLIPQIISLSAKQSDADSCFHRLLGLLESISQRAAYLAFLTEFPQALKVLSRLISASSWASDYLTRHPALLDELLDAQNYYQAPDWQALERAIHTRLTSCGDDIERQLDVLRHIQQEQTFHLLAMDLQQLLPIESLGDHLSELADILLQHVLQLAWQTSRRKHCEPPNFAIIAYGKLGGKELGYASDLDIIFLYQDEHPDAQVNYAKLGQRINTLLSSHTASGRLYETDLRLRPNGASGLLVSNLQAFEDYQHNHAWVWEHQALTRARFSAGDKRLAPEFERIRQQVLCKPRERESLRHEVLAMRQKMHDGHLNNSELFDIKHDSGGMVDIEFMVQYIILAYAHQYPRLTENLGNIGLLKYAAELGLIPQDLALASGDLYRQLRQQQHRLRLNNQSPCRINKQQADIQPCLQLWQYLFGNPETT